MCTKFGLNPIKHCIIGLNLILFIFSAPDHLFSQYHNYNNNSMQFLSYTDTSNTKQTKDKVLVPSFHHYANGFKQVFSTKMNLLYLGTGVVTSLLVRPYDNEISNDLKDTKLKKYDIIHKFNVGGFVSVISAPVFTYIVGRVIKKPYLANTGIYLLEAIVTTQVLTQVTKLTVQRTRPNGENNLSYPSGHTSGIFTIASVLDVRYGCKVGIPSYILASAVGFSRIIQHKHFPTDVIAGATLGIIFGRSFAQSVGVEKSVAVVPIINSNYTGILFQKLL